jgi:hypothetical protein
MNAEHQTAQDVPRFGRAKITTLQRDVNKLRKVIREWNPEATEVAWIDCERWLPAIFRPDAQDQVQKLRALCESYIRSDFEGTSDFAPKMDELNAIAAKEDEE